MNNKEELITPKPSTGDTAHLVASGILSIIPGAAELFRWFVAPPFEKRQHEWMSQVGEVLRTLEKRQSNVIQELQSNEAFVSIVTHATFVALKNHHEVKRTALRNALLNAGVSSAPGEDLQLAFVRFIDELSPSTILLLRLMMNREKEVGAVKSYGDLYELLAPDLGSGLSHDMFKMLCSELEVRGLVTLSPDIGEFPGIYEASALLLEERFTNLPFVRVSDIGRQFVDFIAGDKIRAA